MVANERDADVQAVVDFLDVWRYSSSPSRQCLEDAANQLLDTLSLKARVEAAEQRVRELEEALGRHRDLIKRYQRPLPEGGMTAREKMETAHKRRVEAEVAAERAEAKLATAVEALEGLRGDLHLYGSRSWSVDAMGERIGQALSEIEGGADAG